MATDKQIQALIHKLEEGGWAKWIKLGALLAATFAVAYMSLFGTSGFRGLVNPHAFEQAEIAREIARGHGFATKMVRPAALFQFREFKGSFPIERTPDTYHAPLWSTVLAPFLWLVRDTWEMDKKEAIYFSDRVVAIVATVFFLLSVWVNYFLARRLFDARLAMMATCLLLVSDHLWQFSLSGLPQMFLLFLFTCAMYCLLRAVEKREQERAGAAETSLAALEDDAALDPGEAFDTPSAGLAEPPAVSSPTPPAPRDWRAHLQGPLPWLVGASFLFAAMALTHALTLWIVMGAVFFCALYFRPWGLYAGLMFAIVVLCYTPWLVRNYQVCGMPFGVSWYTGLINIRGLEPAIMRSMDPPLHGISPALFQRKLTIQADAQLVNYFGFLGGVIAAPFFFIALLHRFKRRATANFRWAIAACYAVAFFGMCVFGLDSQEMKSNDLHLLFIPLFTFYGLAFILVLFSRLEVRVRLVRVAFITLLFLISGHTFLVSIKDLLAFSGNRVQWPPYIPPFIALLGSWTKEDEVIMSDMPWAVAWYADRKSLWLPSTVNDFLTLNDWETLQGRIVGLYLTPISGDARYLSDIKKGEFSEWAPFIERTAILKNFPLKAVTALPRDQMCVFYADRDRWTLRED